MSTMPDVNALSMRLRERLEGGTVAVPVLPEIAVRVIDLFNEDDPDPGEMIELVTRDPVLTAHLMKAANSPIMRATARITTVQQAVARLGMRMVGVSALSACLGPQLFRAPAYSGLIDRIWRESLLTGAWAREIARTVRRNNELAFLAGLLHQIGKPIVLHAIQDLDGRTADARSASEVEQLVQEFAALAGSRVATQWKLPAPIAEPIVYWQDFRLAPTARDLVALVAAARRFAITGADGVVAADADACETPEFLELQLDERKVASLRAQSPDVDGLVGAIAT